MGKFVSNRDESVRLFKNPVLEYFSHIHPITPVVVFVPLILIALYFGLQALSLTTVFFTFLFGVLFWTITEYSIHRWAFHYEPKTALGKYIHFLVHGIHHDYPRDSTRLVMPLLVSVPLGAFFYFLFRGAFGFPGVTIFAGFATGYVSYDSIHYATHHMAMKSRIGRFLKNYHLRHHYNDEHAAYGVSNPLWDYVLGTVPSHLKEEKNNKSNNGGLIETL